MKTVPAAILISMIVVSTTNAFMSSNLPFGVKPRTLSSSIGMTVMPDGPDWEGRKPQADTDMSSASSPPFGNDGNSLPADMILPLEEVDPESLSPERLDRMKREEDAKARFLHGDELIELHKYIANMKIDAKKARDKGDMNKLQDLLKALRESNAMDPEYVYVTALENMENAEADGNQEEVEEYRQEAIMARTCLPQFQLSGLHVGKYGDHGYEMVNITYAGGELGNTLVATKVTGDKNVPKGEITFTADLSLMAREGKDLKPIELSDVASKQWGHKYLSRFPGKGQVASEGFVNNQWMDGQLILVGNYFSFAWLPIGHQIFFGRPSAELTLKMLKQSQMSDFGAIDLDSPNTAAEQRAFAQRCFQETELMLFDDEAEDELCFLVDDDDYFYQPGCFE